MHHAKLGRSRDAARGPAAEPPTASPAAYYGAVEDDDAVRVPSFRETHRAELRTGSRVVCTPRTVGRLMFPARPLPPPRFRSLWQVPEKRGFALIPHAAPADDAPRRGNGEHNGEGTTADPELGGPAVEDGVADAEAHNAEAAAATARGAEPRRPSPSCRDGPRAYLCGLVPTDDILSYGQELSGMLGDLGLYIPLVLALSISGQVSLGATLLFSGLSNVITGLTFTIPMCVQPMKSIAAIALADNLTTPQIMASGILTGAIVGALGLTNLITVVNSVVPNSVVRGLQLGLGLNFFRSAMAMLPNKGQPTWHYDDWVQWDGYLPATLALAFALVFVRSKSVPTALLLFLVGLCISVLRMAQAGAQLEWHSPTQLGVVSIAGSDWAVGLLQGALPQVPTTLLNSCLAVCQLADDLYPHRETGVNVRSVAVSVGLINVLFCWFGALPMCHGSGGLAGQYRFGARTNLAVLILGLCKLLLGLLAAPPLLQTLRFFPTSILAALLAISAFELAAAARAAMLDHPDKVRLCLLTCAFTLFCGTAVGFLLGLAAAVLLGASSLVVGTPESVAEARLEASKLCAEYCSGSSSGGAARKLHALRSSFQGRETRDV